MVDRITLRVERTSVVVGDAVLAEGEISPPLPLVPVTIFADTSVVARTVTEVGGTYRAWMVFTRKGVYSVTAKADDVSSPPVRVDVWEYPPEGERALVLAPPVEVPVTPPPVTLEDIRRLLEELLSTVPRWGRPVIPRWVYGSVMIGPPANTVLVSGRIGTGRRGYIYGFSITAEEGNTFELSWIHRGEVRKRVIVLPSMGTVEYVNIIALNEGAEADERTDIAIRNTRPGTTGRSYQATLLYGEGV